MIASGDTGTEPWGHYRPRGLQQARLAFYRSKIKHRGLKKRLRGLKKRFYRHLVKRASVFDVVRGGIKLRCRIADNITEHDTVFGGPYDNAREMAVLISRLRPGDTFVDVGANCGVYSLAAAGAVGAAGQVVAIEPNPAMAERLRFNIVANDFHNIRVVEAAVGDEPGVAQLRLRADELGQSSLVSRADGPSISVPVRTLQDVLAQCDAKRIDAMKLDIEGFEDRAIMPLLRSASCALWPQVILIEKVHAHLWQDDCVGHMIAAGYIIDWESQDDVLLTFPVAPEQ